MRLKLAVAALLGLGAGGCYIVATPYGLGVGLAMRPIYAPIVGTGIRVVTNATGDVFHYGGSYYRWWSGRWWRSPTWRSGWTPIAVVPRVFLSIPRTHRMYRVVKHHPLHQVHQARPTHPVVRAKVRKEVREEVRGVVREKVKHRPAAPARPARTPKDKKKEKEKEKEKDKEKRGRR